MKGFSVLFLCMLLAVAGTANVDLVVNVTAGNVGLAATTSAGPTGYTIVDLWITSLPSGMTGLQAVEGTWTATGGTFYVYNKGATNATYQFNTTYSGIDAGYSGLNLSTANAAAVWTRDGGVTKATTLIQGSWTNGGINADRLVAGANRDTTAEPTNSDGLAMNLLAQMVVTNSTTEIAFSSSGNSGFGYGPSGTVLLTGFKVPLPVPEPSTLALLGCGLFGLLAYAWRKRK
jgi:hypothetical protein